MSGRKYEPQARAEAGGGWSGGFLRRRTARGTVCHDWRDGFASEAEAVAYGAERLLAVSRMTDVMRDRARERQSKAGKEHGRGQSIALGKFTQSYDDEIAWRVAKRGGSEVETFGAAGRAKSALGKFTQSTESQTAADNVVPFHTREGNSRTWGRW